MSFHVMCNCCQCPNLARNAPAQSCELAMRSKCVQCRQAQCVRQRSKGWRKCSAHSEHGSSSNTECCVAGSHMFMLIVKLGAHSEASMMLPCWPNVLICVQSTLCQRASPASQSMVNCRMCRVQWLPATFRCAQQACKESQVHDWQDKRLTCS
jgi:hypothetical protein